MLEMQNPKRRTLNKMETFKLMGLIEKDYSDRKETDGEFAKYACAALHLEGINSKHIERARNSLGITATFFAKASAQKSLPLAALQNLEARICVLEKTLQKWQTLFPNLKVE